MPERPITSLLIANRGEIAIRIARTARTMGMRTVAVFVDADDHAPHVRAADEAVRLPGTYLDADAIVAAAVQTGADAVHPGYGFLSENAAFAEAVGGAGLVWVGPTPAAIAAMGDKLAAKAIAAAADVPMLASSPDPADAAAVGFPLIVKAAAGGGGKGMRLVHDPADLDDAVAAARREAEAGFGDATVFVERYVARARHVEIQILGDRHGNLVHLGERDCSIQRRHQKIIEEAPSPALDPARRAEMGAAALRLAAEIGYQSAGTVEFLLDDDTGEYFFLEVNTRLQVEHPVTEAITGIDLVREQLRIAAGEPLGYAQDAITFVGHAIEARLYAEDTAAGFLPATGTLVAFETPTDPTVRWDSGVEVGSVVGLGFDPMLAKVISHAPTRTEAAAQLALALERLHIGGVTTNRGFLASTLRNGSFLAGETTTDFIDRVGPGHGVTPDADLLDAAIAAAMWLQAENRAAAPVLGGLPSGWRNARLPRQQVRLDAGGGRVVTVEYASRRDGGFDVVAAIDPVGDPQSSGAAIASGSDAPRLLDVAVHRTEPIGSAAPGSGSEHRGGGIIDVEIAGRRRTVQVAHVEDRLVVQGRTGPVEFAVAPRFAPPDAAAAAGGLVAPMPGIVLAVEVAPGAIVTGGQVLAVLEAMKMEHRIEAPGDGVVAQVLVTVGDQVQAGDALFVLDDSDAEASPPD
ncbi:MAG: biotin carboxylase N-terminal domain-containing protein [Acidimicrobiales bacterium]